MNTTLTDALPLNEQDLVNIFKQALAEGVQAMPKPGLPPWVEGIGSFIKMHPGICALIVVLILIISFFVVREFICSYFKINEILARLRKIEENTR